MAGYCTSVHPYFHEPQASENTANNCMDGSRFSSQGCCMSNWCEKDVVMGLCQYVDLAFMHHPYLVCILFGMPSLHLFTFAMFLFSCFYTFLMLISVI